MFKECLLNKVKVKRFMTQLRSKNHQIVVNRVHKVALSSYDDKRYILHDGIHSFEHRHYKIQGEPSSKGYSLSHCLITFKIKTRFFCFSESDASSLYSHSGEEIDNEIFCYSNNALSDTDVDDSQRATPLTLHSFLKHHECFY